MNDFSIKGRVGTINIDAARYLQIEQDAENDTALTMSLYEQFMDCFGGGKREEAFTQIYNFVKAQKILNSETYKTPFNCLDASHRRDLAYAFENAAMAVSTLHDLATKDFKGCFIYEANEKVNGYLNGGTIQLREKIPDGFKMLFNVRYAPLDSGEQFENFPLDSGLTRVVDEMDITGS